MGLMSRRAPRAAPAGTVTGPVKVDRRTRRLAGRLRPGDIALIDHVDLDRVSAEALVAAGAAAVLNAKPSISGRYPNLGPELLVARGVPLIDDLGEDVFQHCGRAPSPGSTATPCWSAGRWWPAGVRQDAERVAQRDGRRPAGGLPSRWSRSRPTRSSTCARSATCCWTAWGCRPSAPGIEGRHCLVVVRGDDYRADLAALRPYIREFRPVLIGVDGGADALLEAGHRPDLIVGDMEAVSDAAMRCGAELVVHVHPDGRGSGLARANQLNLPAVTFTAAATSEDLALLLADAKGASVIVAVGAPRHAGRVPRPGSRRHGLDLPDPAAAGWPARRREGGRAAAPAGAVDLGGGAAGARPRWRRWPPGWPPVRWAGPGSTHSPSGGTN